MITQEKMYQILYDNKEFVNYVINTHFLIAVPNEKTYKTLLNNNIYLKFLCLNNADLIKNKNTIFSTLNLFEDKFWLKKDSFAFFKMLKYIKRNKITINMATKILTNQKLINGYYAYLKYLENFTKTKVQTLIKINNIFEQFGIIETLKFLIENKLVK